MPRRKERERSHRTVAAREAGGAVGAAERSRLAPALPSPRAGAQHVGAAEGILDELVRPLRARQAGPPSAEHRGEQNEAQDDRGDEQESAHDPIPGRGESRASGGSRDPDRGGGGGEEGGGA